MYIMQSLVIVPDDQNLLLPESLFNQECDIGSYRIILCVHVVYNEFI